MPTFKTTSEMENYIKSKMQVALVKTQETIYQVINRFVKEYYAEFSPSVYERTYQLYQSLVKTDVESTGNGYKISVYFDPNRLDYAMKTVTAPSGKKYKVANKGWSEEKTLSSAAHGSHGGYVKGTAIYDEPAKMLKKDAVKILKRMLIEAGLPVK